MARDGVPGVAVGVLSQGTEYVRDYGVTNVDYPVPVDGDTLFRNPESAAETFPQIPVEPHG
jgi:CubicO group peptidase (beta-lactamase class C family)